MKKPDATTIITEDNFRQIVWPLPVGDLLYIGRATRRKLQNRAIGYLPDLGKEVYLFCDEGRWFIEK